MNKTTSRKSRRSPSSIQISELKESIQSHKSALEKMRLEKVALSHQMEKATLEFNQDRMFWFWLVYNFRFHHSRLSVVGSCGGEEALQAEESVRTATLDLLMSPSEPSSTYTRNHRQDHQLHRVLAGSGGGMIAELARNPQQER